jgi:hypothetical protein
MTERTTLFDDVVSITAEYLGPAAERFVARQIETHLNIPPQKLQRKQLTNLLDWLRLSMSLLTNNQQLVDEYINKVRALAIGK